MLKILADQGLIEGKTSASIQTLEANAALRSIVRRETGRNTRSSSPTGGASGIETPTREELAKLDRKRPKKGATRMAEPARPGREDHQNEGWAHPTGAQGRARGGHGQRRDPGGERVRCGAWATPRPSATPSAGQRKISRAAHQER